MRTLPIEAVKQIGQFPNAVAPLRQRLDEAADALRLRLEQGGALAEQCNFVALIKNSSGRWREIHVFRLPQGDFAANPAAVC